jgi:5-methylcytosine-specific restriction endonuclease McrA
MLLKHWFEQKVFCERCNKSAPFIRKTDSSPYLEVHHIISLAKGRNDELLNVLALCPKSHREIHCGNNQL